MMGILLIVDSQQSLYVNVAIWVLLIVLLFVSVFFVIYQMKHSKVLHEELDYLGKVKKRNVETEFILKAMRIATWHLDLRTGVLAYDYDFRDKWSGWMWSPSDSNDVTETLPLLMEEDAEYVGKALKSLCAGETDKYHVEYRVKIPHTDSFYWEESYAAVSEHDENGKPLVVVGTSKRIDDKKMMESELVEARNRAEESDRLKTSFLANMSHEIRTPLNAIIGFTSVLPDLPDGPERQELLNLIQENTQKLLRIIDDVVNISKIEAGKEELNLMQFDLATCIIQVMDEFTPKLKPDVKFVKDYNVESQMITTDYTRLMEILKHLVSNAVKFTDKGQVSIGFSEPAEGRIKIWVADTGKGIAKEHQEKIFERFFKVDEFIPGAGLGLSVCHTMAYSLGGSVKCESQLGEGAVFTVEIPCS